MQGYTASRYAVHMPERWNGRGAPGHIANFLEICEKEGKEGKSEQVDKGTIC